MTDNDNAPKPKAKVNTNVLERLKVVVFLASTESGDRVWAAQSLEQDLATQISPGGTMREVVDSLGSMFEARDAMVSQYAKEGIVVMDAPEAPELFDIAWEAGVDHGEYDLGLGRVARVREVEENTVSISWSGESVLDV